MALVHTVDSRFCSASVASSGMDDVANFNEVSLGVVEGHFQFDGIENVQMDCADQLMLMMTMDSEANSPHPSNPPKFATMAEKTVDDMAERDQQIEKLECTIKLLFD